MTTRDDDQANNRRYDRIPQWVSTALVSLLITAVTSGFGAIVLINVHDNRIGELEKWRQSSFFLSPRFTPADGERILSSCKQDIAYEAGARAAENNRLGQRVERNEAEIEKCRQFRESQVAKSSVLESRIDRIEREKR